jgi:hypothetical protein
MKPAMHGYWLLSDVARSYARTVLEIIIDRKLRTIATFQPTDSGTYSAFSAKGKKLL